MLEYGDFIESSWLRWSADKKENAKICIMGIPFDNGVSLNKGTSKGPETMRSLSVDLSDTTDDFELISDNLIYDAGDVPVELNWEKYFKTVEDKAYELLQDNQICLFLGGDHSVTIPLHKAFFKHHRANKIDAKIGILHFDAHYDLCHQYDGHKWSHACTEARALEDLKIGDQDLTFVGVRVAEAIELELLKKHPGIHTITAADVYDRGTASVVSDLTDRYGDYDAVYLTLDIDVLDPAYAPGTGTPASGGLSSMDLIKIFKQIIRKLPIKAMDIVEVSPPLDVNNITSWAALKIIHELFSFASKK